MKDIQEKISFAFAEYWNSILETVPRIVVGLLLFIIVMLVAYIVKRILRTQLVSRVEDTLLINFILRIVNIVFITLGIIVFMGQVGWGKAASGLLAGAGVSAIVIGFAFKDIGENFLAGFFLAFGRPFSIGDVIEIQDVTGTVKAMYFRSTHVRTFDGKDVYIPNGMIVKDKLINYTRDGLLRHNYTIGLDYGTDLKQAVADILSTMESFKDIDQDPSRKPFVMIKNLGTSTINLDAYFWTNEEIFNGSIASLKTSIVGQIVSDLIAKGYGMPADMVELKIYNEKQPIPIQLMEGATLIKPNEV